MTASLALLVMVANGNRACFWREGVAVEARDRVDRRAELALVGLLKSVLCVAKENKLTTDEARDMDLVLLPLRALREDML